MSGHGADWYKREPQAYLGGVVGMTAKQHAVYGIVLDLIYAHGGSCHNDPKWIAGWFSDLGPSTVRKTIAELLLIPGKLTLAENGDLTNGKAEKEVKTKEKLSETRGKAGRKGGILSGISRSQSKENNDLNEATPLAREDKIREEGKRETKVSPKKATRLSPDWYLPKGWGEWAITDIGMDVDRVKIESEKFRDYWIAKSGQSATKADWFATWRNWCRKALEHNPQQRSKSRGQERFDGLKKMAADIDRRGKADSDLAGGEGAGDVVPLLPARFIG